MTRALQNNMTKKNNLSTTATFLVDSPSPGLEDFAIRLVNSVLNLPDGQVMFFEEFKLQKNFNSAHQMFLGLVEMMFGLVC